ncbi:hypothetical protein D3C72_1388530 [compost metagenome]
MLLHRALAAGVERNRAFHLRRAGRPRAAGIDGGQHRLRAVGPAQQHDTRGVDRRLLRHPAKRGQRIGAARAVVDAARVDGFGADAVGPAARAEAVGHQHGIAALVQPVRVFAVALLQQSGNVRLVGSGGTRRARARGARGQQAAAAVQRHHHRQRARGGALARQEPVGGERGRGRIAAQLDTLRRHGCRGRGSWRGPAHRIRRQHAGGRQRRRLRQRGRGQFRCMRGCAGQPCAQPQCHRGAQHRHRRTGGAR